MTCEIDEKSLTVRAQADMSLAELRAQLAAAGFVIDAGGEGTVGEWIAAGAPGARGSVAVLECTLPGGKQLTTPDSPRSAAGPDFKQLFIGAGNTLGEITAAKLRVHRAPEQRAVVAIDFPDWQRGCEALREVAQRGLSPRVSLLDESLSEKHGAAKGVLAVFVCEGMQRLAEFDAAKIAAICNEHYGRRLDEVKLPAESSAANVTVTWTELPALCESAREAGMALVLSGADITGATLGLAGKGAGKLAIAHAPRLDPALAKLHAAMSAHVGGVAAKVPRKAGGGA